MIEPGEFREAMSAWPSGVTIVACRVDGRVVATTVTAFLSLSLDPPQVLVALGPNATVRPYAAPGAGLGISILSAGQKRLAAIHADPFPVGPDPFDADGFPLLADALVALGCVVEQVQDAADHALVIARVHEIRRSDGAPLIRYRRRYHAPDL